MKRAAPLIAAALLLAFGALSQTTYLGNILQMHRQAGPLPSATSYQGAIVYNLDAGVLYFSNGTIWAPIAGDAGSGSGGGGDTLWVDAGSGGIFNSPNSQVRVGRAQVEAPTITLPTGQPFNTANFIVYSDGGYTAAFYKNETEFVANINRLNPLNANYRGANLTLSTDYSPSGPAYTQVLLYGGGQNTDQFSTITEANGALGSYVAGLNLTSTAALGFTSNSNVLNAMGIGYPSWYITTHQASLGQININASSRFTLTGANLTNAIYVLAGSPAATNGMQFDSNSLRLDVGTGSNDYIESNGTRVHVGDLSGGGLSAANLRAAGNTNATTTVTSVTTGSGGIGFNQASNTLYSMATGKEARPILSGLDWVYDGRSWDVEVQFEQTACPVLRKTLSSSAGADVAVSCSDDTAATSTTGAGFPARAYRNFIANGSAGDRSIFTSGTAPATGAGATLTAFVQRGGGPVTKFWMRVNEDWSSNVLWYGGLMAAVPTSGQPATSTNSVYVRYNRATDSNFQLCATDGSARTCTAASSVAPANATEYLMVIDCRESSTSCYLYINGSYQAAVSANLPAVSNWMGFGAAVEFVSTSSRSFGLGRVSVSLE